MAKGTRICKVCGAEYPYCKTNRPTGTFRWQDVACSPEHGSIYLSKINASRVKKAQGAAPVNAVPQTMNKKEAPVKEDTAAKEEPTAEEDASVEDVTDVVEEGADNTIWVADEATDRFKTWTASATYHPVAEREEDSDDEDDVNEDDDDSWIDDDDEND